MAELIMTSTDNDIYATWGRNKTRIDLPAYGPEYQEWKVRTPSDVQKIVLDWMVARRLAKMRGHRTTRDQMISSYLPITEYEKTHNHAIDIGQKIADTVYPFVSLRYPELLPHILAIGVDGSSLYHPRTNGDIDVWLMVDNLNPDINQCMQNYYDRMPFIQLADEEISLRPAELSLKRAHEAGYVPSLAFPHKLIQLFNFSPDLYNQAIVDSIQETRNNKEKIYERARSLFKIKT